MRTEKKYYDNVYLREHKAEIISAALDEKAPDICIIELSSTIFFPTGGGQSCDLGTVNGFEVTEVKEKGESILHLIKLPDAAIPSELSVGSEAHLVLDWDRRFDNMQRHCGEHILSGIFFREYGGVNRGFHMGEDYMTIDISLEEKPEFTKLTYDMCKHVELCANQVIWADAPVSRRVYATRAETEGLPLRKALAIDSDISIVCVGSEENAADCVACCGTHPATAGQVGLIKIFKVEPNKGMFRVYCEAGRRAFMDYSLKHDIFTELANKYSATTATLREQIAREDAKIQKLRDELYVLRHSVIKERASAISADMAARLSESGVYSYEYDDLSVDDLFAVGRALTADIPKLLFLICARENTLVLLSDGKTCACGQLVKEYAPIYNGKGGGKADNARAIFPSREMLNTFMDLVEKHLR